ncbi:MAG TPA: YbaK/EbsC family protein [Candidatus Nanoarchaeia archaeon]|nr:YbaK/EbsC family protein [Candidatus Nanoarchaeia archaeon]
MGIEEVERVKKIFSELHLNPIYMEHEAVLTSQQAAETRGFELKQGIKAILFANGLGDFALVNVPADKKINQKKVAEVLGWNKKDIRMATEEEVLEQTGCQIGSVPPFGHKNKIKLLLDVGVYDNEESDFNIGLRTQSVKIKTEEMRRVFHFVDAEEGQFAK